MLKHTHMAVLIAVASLIAMAGTGAQAAPEQAAEPTTRVVLASEVVWEHLNPARGDKSPSAGTLWGDRNGTGPTGFLLRPTDGFESPPHIHNVSYRGVVISGLIHNDDPDAAEMWLPAGSFWTQPKGEVHITAAQGTSTLAYIEIEEGPYLVLPAEEEFDSGERPINVDETNLVWLDAASITWVDQPGQPAAADGPKVAFLWGNPEDDHLNGTLVKLPAGFTGSLSNHGSTFHAVVVQGRPEHQVPSETDNKILDPGSYFSSKEKTAHRIIVDSAEDCLLYVRTNGKYVVKED